MSLILKSFIFDQTGCQWLHSPQTTILADAHFKFKLNIEDMIWNPLIEAFLYDVVRFCVPLTVLK